MLSLVADCAALLLLLWVIGNGLIIVVYRRDLRCLWREPVFRHPILIIESDDWGAGPLTQAAALRDIATVLARHRDATGRAPVLNLALVLAVPDGPAIEATGAYRRNCLDDPMFGPILSALREGQSRGLFALQLHGLEHFWSDSLMANRNERVMGWLRQAGPAVTEHLPSHLQSRWVEAAALPSKPHAEGAIRAAAAEEVRTYTRIFGAPPRIVVPPTFVWTRDVESAWADQGLDCIVTPGWRYTSRNAQGLPDGDEGPIANGDRDRGVIYLVRSDYFEPARGRDAAYALKALERATSEGRPSLLENHRDNFIDDPQACQHSLAELDKVYREALARYADLRFLSSADLSRVLRDRDPQWLITKLSGRLPNVWVRLRHTGRLWKLVTLTGLAAICSALVRVLTASSVRMPGASNSMNETKP